MYKLNFVEFKSYFLNERLIKFDIVLKDAIRGGTLNYFIFSIMFLVSIISIQLVIYIFLNRKKIPIRGFLGLIISVFIYSSFYIMELIAPSIEYMKLYTAIQSLGTLSIPAFWIILAMHYTNRGKVINKRFFALLFFIPIILMILNFTNEYHHLFYKNYTYNIIYSLNIADIKPGIFYYVGMIYVNVCFFIGNILYLHNFFGENKLYKKRSFIILITSFIPWFGYWIYMSGIMVVKIDIIPISLSILCLFYAYALFNSNIFGTIDLARKTVFNNITDAIILLDKQNILIEVNKKAEQIFNIESNSIIGKKSNDIFKVHDKFSKSIDENKFGIFNMEFEVNGVAKYFQVTIYSLKNNKNEGKIIILVDNTEQMELNNRLKYYATMDILTGVYNKNYFQEIAVDKLQESFKLNKPVSLIIFDLDKFKDINDIYGHIAGDIVLEKAIGACKVVLDGKYCIGRYGGEEFVILLNDTTFEKAFEIAEDIRIAIENEEILYDENIIKITSSFGVFSCYEEKDLKDLLKNADKALYEAKKLGRNRVCGNIDLVV